MSADVERTAIQYPRYQVYNDHILASLSLSKVGEKSRKRCFFRVRNFFLILNISNLLSKQQGTLKVDENANYRHRPVVPTDRLIYGKVLAFYVHTFEGNSHTLAHVQLFKDTSIDEYGIGSSPGKFKYEASLMVPTDSIHALIGLVYNSTMKRTYFLDREVIVDIPLVCPPM